MAIFGRSKKSKPTTTPPPPQSNYNSAPNPSSSNVLTSNPNWAYVEQRPNNPYGNGYGPQPSGWLIAPVPPQHQPLFLKQEYHPPQSSKLQNGGGNLGTLKLASVSVANLLNGDVPACVPGAKYFNNGISPLHSQGAQYINQGVGLCDMISSKFDAVITLIDGERFSGDERELAVVTPPHPMWQQEQEQSGYAEKGIGKGKSKGMVNNSVSSALTSTNYFAKVNLYANSRLPLDLRPMKLYMSTFPILCLAAQYSERVYIKPGGRERETHVDSDWRMGTKAMVIKSVPMDDMNTIVFAIRGTQTFMDWAVNLRSAPESPEGFLDDPGNLCHAGFLTVAKKMIKPVAARLRHLLEEDPGRSKCSLLITGHSAGGAVAALLYSHMLSTSPETESELNILTGCFKRVHCISFGAPPVSLLPLAKPNNPAYQKSLFYSFVNEGDPVPRADKAYIRSLLDLYAHPAPGQACPLTSGLGKSSSSLAVDKKPKKSKNAPVYPDAPLWPVPETALSNAGRIILLRSVERYENRGKKKDVHERMNEGVVAQIVDETLLRGVIWGDPVCHMMSLYSRRIEILATNAVTGRS